MISYPKAGRTWLRILLGSALCSEYGLDRSALLDTAALSEAAGLPRTDLHHDGSELGARLDYAALPADKGEYRGADVIFLARDPRDALVSAYFEATRRSFLFTGEPVDFDGSLSDFVRSRRFGAAKVAAFYESWSRSRRVPRRFLLLRYEELHVAPREALARVLRFLGARVSAVVIDRAVEHASFRHMRRLERADAFADPRLRPGDPDDPESYKTRRGVVGGYADYLSPADIAYVEEELARRGWPLMR